MYTRNKRGSHLVQEREKIGHVRIGMLIEPRHQLVERDLPVSINVEFLHDDVGHFEKLRGAQTVIQLGLWCARFRILACSSVSC